MQFREANGDDSLGSSLRLMALSWFRSREFLLKDIADESLILSDANNHLADWQVNPALQHWHRIRSVLADEVWNNY